MSNEVPEENMSEDDAKIDLRDYVDKRLDDLKELMNARFDAAELAVEVARHEVDRRLEGMNELRDQIASERGHFASRDALDQLRQEFGSRMTRADYEKSSRREQPN